MPTPRPDPLYGNYESQCTEPGCLGRQRFEHCYSARLTVGKLLEEDKSNPSFGRCPHCRRYSMRVTAVPPPVPPPKPKGFTRIPTE